MLSYRDKLDPWNFGNSNASNSLTNSFSFSSYWKSDKMTGLIWIHIVRYSEGIPGKYFEKVILL